MAYSNKPVVNGRVARQALLDYLNQHGPSIGRHISTGLGLNHSSTMARLGQMRDAKEVAAEVVENPDKPGQGVLKFTALVVEGACYKAAQMEGGPRERKLTLPPANPKKPPPGVTRNFVRDDDEWLPKPRRGGQSMVHHPRFGTALEMAL